MSSTLRRSQSLKNLPGAQKTFATPCGPLVDKRKTVSQLVQKYQSLSDLRDIDSEDQVKKPTVLFKTQNSSRNDSWKGFASVQAGGYPGLLNIPPLSRSLSTDALSSRVVKGTEALRALFESKASLRKDNASVRKDKGYQYLSVKEVCSACLKEVYPVEKVVADERILHMNCFCCKHCKTKLSMHRYSAVYGDFYCTSHYQQLFKRKGNYDEGFGYQQHKDQWLPKKANPTPETKSSSAPKCESTCIDSPGLQTRLSKRDGNVNTKGRPDNVKKLNVTWPPENKGKKKGSSLEMTKKVPYMKQRYEDSCCESVNSKNKVYHVQQTAVVKEKIKQTSDGIKSKYTGKPSEPKLAIYDKGRRVGSTFHHNQTSKMNPDLENVDHVSKHEPMIKTKIRSNVVSINSSCDVFDGELTVKVSRPCSDDGPPKVDTLPSKDRFMVMPPSPSSIMQGNTDVETKTKRNVDEVCEGLEKNTPTIPSSDHDNGYSYKSTIPKSDHFPETQERRVEMLSSHDSTSLKNSSSKERPDSSRPDKSSSTGEKNTRKAVNKTMFKGINPISKLFTSGPNENRNAKQGTKNVPKRVNKPEHGLTKRLLSFTKKETPNEIPTEEKRGNRTVEDKEGRVEDSTNVIGSISNTIQAENIITFSNPDMSDVAASPQGDPGTLDQTPDKNLNLTSGKKTIEEPTASITEHGSNGGAVQEEIFRAQTSHRADILVPSGLETEAAVEVGVDVNSNISTNVFNDVFDTESEVTIMTSDQISNQNDISDLIDAHDIQSPVAPQNDQFSHHADIFGPSGLEPEAATEVGVDVNSNVSTNVFNDVFDTESEVTIMTSDQKSNQNDISDLIDANDIQSPVASHNDHFSHRADILDPSGLETEAAAEVGVDVNSNVSTNVFNDIFDTESEITIMTSDLIDANYNPSPVAPQNDHFTHHADIFGPSGLETEAAAEVGVDVNSNVSTNAINDIFDMESASIEGTKFTLESEDQKSNQNDISDLIDANYNQSPVAPQNDQFSHHADIFGPSGLETEAAAEVGVDVNSNISTNAFNEIFDMESAYFEGTKFTLESEVTIMTSDPKSNQNDISDLINTNYNPSPVASQNDQFSHRADIFGPSGLETEAAAEVGVDVNSNVSTNDLNDIFDTESEITIMTSDLIDANYNPSPVAPQNDHFTHHADIFGPSGLETEVAAEVGVDVNSNISTNVFNDVFDMESASFEGTKFTLESDVTIMTSDQRSTHNDISDLIDANYNPSPVAPQNDHFTHHADIFGPSGLETEAAAEVGVDVNSNVSTNAINDIFDMESASFEGTKFTLESEVTIMTSDQKSNQNDISNLIDANYNHSSVAPQNDQFSHHADILDPSGLETEAAAEVGVDVNSNISTNVFNDIFDIESASIEGTKFTLESEDQKSNQNDISDLINTNNIQSPVAPQNDQFSHHADVRGPSGLETEAAAEVGVDVNSNISTNAFNDVFDTESASIEGTNFILESEVTIMTSDQKSNQNDISDLIDANYNPSSVASQNDQFSHFKISEPLDVFSQNNSKQENSQLAFCGEGETADSQSAIIQEDANVKPKATYDIFSDGELTENNNTPRLPSSDDGYTKNDITDLFNADYNQSPVAGGHDHFNLFSSDNEISEHLDVFDQNNSKQENSQLVHNEFFDIFSSESGSSTHVLDVVDTSKAASENKQFVQSEVTDSLSLLEDSSSALCEPSKPNTLTLEPSKPDSDTLTLEPSRNTSDIFNDFSKLETQIGDVEIKGDTLLFEDFTVSPTQTNESMSSKDDWLNDFLG